MEWDMSACNVDLHHRGNASKHLAMFLFLVAKSGPQDSEFLEASVYDLVPGHKSRHSIKGISTSWYRILYNRRSSSSNTVPRVGEVIFVRCKALVEITSCDTGVRPCATNKRAIEVHDVARGNTQCHLIAKTWTVKLVASSAGVKWNILNGFNVSPVNSYLRCPSVITNQPVFPTNLFI